MRSELLHGSTAQKPDRGFAVCVLREDPGLCAMLDEPDRPAAVRAAIASGFELACGAWVFSPAPDPAALGALILGGLIVVRLQVGDRAHVELLGQGDVISPWVGPGSDLNVPCEMTASIVSPLRIALLDHRFALRAARWPQIQAGLMRRAINRARYLSLQAAINAVPRVRERVELTLWQLADRFGRVTSDGVLLPLPLTHALLGELVAAQRPSVTMALRGLDSAHRVLRPARDEWLLRGEPPAPPRLTRETGLRR